MKKRYNINSEIQTLQYIQMKWIWKFLFEISIFLIPFIVIITIWALVIDHSTLNINIIILITVPLVMIWSSILRKYFQSFFMIWKILRRNIQDIHELIRINIHQIQHIDDILRKTKSCLIILRQVHFLYRFRYLLFSNDSYGILRALLGQLPIFIISVLTDLRSDLSIRITEQQQSLESAKSEVEKNIAWTTELNQVSELQRARLDRQIEQFEELQRVLVKV